MRSADESQAILRPVAQAAAVIIVCAFVAVQMLPIPDWRRWLLDALLVVSGVLAVVMLRYVLPRARLPAWTLYCGAAGYIALIAAGDYLLRVLDLSPLYLLAIIITAIIAHRRAALFAALLASILQPGAAIAAGGEPGVDWPLHAVVYVISALLVAELASVLAQRWRVAAAEAEAQRQEIARRKDDLEGLHEISQAFANLEDTRETFRQVTARTAQLLGAEMCIITRLVADGARVQGVPPGYGLSDEQVANFGYTVDREIVALWNIAQREHFLLNDLTRLPPALAAIAQSLPVRQIVGARMMWRGRPSGLIFAANKRNGGAFEEKDARLLSILAAQAAVAVENARLYGDAQTSALENARLWRVEQRKAMEFAALAGLSRSLAETMDLDEIFRVIERQVRAIMPIADAGALLTYDSQNDVLIPRASFGFDREILHKMALRPGESIVGQVFQANRAMLFSGREAVKAARQSMRLENQALFAAASYWGVYSESVICAPIHAGSDVLGVIVLNDFKSSNGFTEDDLSLLEAMADRAGLAIRNAQLYAHGLRRAAQLAAIAEVGRRVTAILDLNVLLPTVAELIHARFGYRYVHLFLSDHAARAAVFCAGAGPAAAALQQEPLSIRFEEGIIGYVARTGETLLANDVSKEPRYLYHPALADTRAELAVPLQAGTSRLGVLDVQSETVNAFESSDVTALETLVSQVAIAIENARLYGEMREQARRDSLTQVYNHGFFLERLAEEVNRAQQEEHPLSLIMLDIDYFKDYNDQHGHVIGDDVLSAIAQAIRAHIKRTDLAGRWGGEEFAIALPETDTPRARVVAERIRQTVAAAQLPHKNGVGVAPPTVSQGIATFPTHARDTATLVDLADAALYRAKARGRDQVCVSGEA